MLERKVVAAHGKMLRSTPIAVDPVGEAQPVKLLRFIAVEAVFGDDQLQSIPLFKNLRLYDQIFGGAEFVRIFGAEAGDLTGLNLLIAGNGEAEKMVAETGVEAGALHIPRIDKHFEAVPFLDRGVYRFDGGALREHMEMEPLFVPPQRHFGEGDLIAERGGVREQIIFWIAHLFGKIMGVGFYLKKTDRR